MVFSSKKVWLELAWPRPRCWDLPPGTPLSCRGHTPGRRGKPWWPRSRWRLWPDTRPPLYVSCSPCGLGAPTPRCAPWLRSLRLWDIVCMSNSSYEILMADDPSANESERPRFSGPMRAHLGCETPGLGPRGRLRAGSLGQGLQGQESLGRTASCCWNQHPGFLQSAGSQRSL